MANEVAAYDPEAFRKKVAERITNSFADLIPEEQFQKMVDAQIKVFVETTFEIKVKSEDIFDKSQRWNKIGERQILNVSLTPFQQMVWMELKPIVLEKLQAYLAGPQSALNKFVAEVFESKEFADGQVLGVEKLMVAMASSVFEQMAEKAAMNFGDRLKNAAFNANMPDLAHMVLRAQENR